MLNVSNTISNFNTQHFLSQWNLTFSPLSLRETNSTLSAKLLAWLNWEALMIIADDVSPHHMSNGLAMPSSAPSTPPQHTLARQSNSPYAEASLQQQASTSYAESIGFADESVRDWGAPTSSAHQCIPAVWNTAPSHSLHLRKLSSRSKSRSLSIVTDELMSSASTPLFTPRLSQLLGPGMGPSPPRSNRQY